MTVFTQYFILSQQQSLNSSHQWTTLTCQVRSSFTLESSFKQISWTYTDTQCNGTIHSFTRSILIDSVRRVQTTTFEEHSTQWSTRTFRSYHDYVDIFLRNYTCTVAPSDSETMREVKSFSRSQVRFDSRPYRHYGCIRQQAHNDSTFLTSLLNAKQCFTRYPSVSYCFLISLTRTLSNDYVETVIAQVACLSRSLYTITDHCNCFIFQNFTCFFQRKLFAGHYILSNTAKI